jgi:hypothetical protein
MATGITMNLAIDPMTEFKCAPRSSRSACMSRQARVKSHSNRMSDGISPVHQISGHVEEKDV